ncbi:hypothetical protein ACHAW5_006286 [Stephanodiscus triporus]|uniref:MgtC/SapB/SrpB/YhiD N-terminal domain-containing protein n=1 Tax=Stephanodiscus triporus TaxID=2934178 RepID=A0ABD3NTJ4_9STRA
MPSNKEIVYIFLAIYVACTAVAVVVEPFATDLPCDHSAPSDSDGMPIKFPNALFEYQPCRVHERYLRLMGLTRQECRFGRHMVVSVVLGSLIGYERRSADRPAGIRTMSVVSLAACLFTLNSTFVFMIGPMHWDPARVSAAVPSGVGFLGAGLMVQDALKDDFTGHTHHTIKGIATAASVWLSAAVGVACGGGMYFAATFTSMLLLVLLRFGPRPPSARRPSSSSLQSLGEVGGRVDSIRGEARLEESSTLPIFRRGVHKSQSLNFH